MQADRIKILAMELTSVGDEDGYADKLGVILGSSEGSELGWDEG